MIRKRLPWVLSIVAAIAAVGLHADLPPEPVSVLTFVYPREGEALMPDPPKPAAFPERILLMDCSGVNAAWREIPGLDPIEQIIRALPGVKETAVVKTPGSFSPIFSYAFNVDWMADVFAKHPADAVGMVFSTYGRPSPSTNLPATLMAGNPAAFGTPGMALLSIVAAIAGNASPQTVETEFVLMAWPSCKLLMRVRAQDPLPPDGKAHRPNLTLRTRVYQELARQVSVALHPGPVAPGPDPKPDPKRTAGPVRLGVMLAALGEGEIRTEEALPSGKALPSAFEQEVLGALREEGKSQPWIQSLDLMPWIDLAGSGAQGQLTLKAQEMSLDYVAIVLVARGASPNQFAFRWWYPYLTSLDRFAGSHWPHVMYAQIQLKALLMRVDAKEPSQWMLGFGSERGPEYVSRWGYPTQLVTPQLPVALKRACHDLMVHSALLWDGRNPPAE